ncbi:MAG TPA: hypothetical protein VJV78_44730 [Polyangiales bacterium]|nr:hypothetical protein [Polyangiales bacterium]
MDEREMVDAYYDMAIERWLKRLQDPTCDVSRVEITVPRYVLERNGSDARLREL